MNEWITQKSKSRKHSSQSPGNTNGLWSIPILLPAEQRELTTFAWDFRVALHQWWLTSPRHLPLPCCLSDYVEDSSTGLKRDYFWRIAPKQPHLKSDAEVTEGWNCCYSWDEWKLHFRWIEVIAIGCLFAESSFQWLPSNLLFGSEMPKGEKISK